MAIQIMNKPVIDNHCHPFPIERIPAQLERMWTLSLNPIPSEDLRHGLFYQMMLREVREYHGFAPDTPVRDVMQRSHEMYLADPSGYTEALWKNANLQMIIGDIGSGVKKDSKRLTAEEIADFERQSQFIQVGKVNRIEFFTEDILSDGVPYTDFQDCFIETVKRHIQEEHLIGLKSIIAYRTGLDVIPPTELQFKEAYHRFLSNRNDLEAEKVIRAHVFLTAAQLCAELDIPLQVHAGAGDAPICDLRLHDPVQLYQAINDPRARDTKIILLHASYPIVEHASYLASQYSNIYTDVSSMVPYMANAGEARLRTMLESLPFTKLLYGSDGSVKPDFLWYSAKYFKRVLQKVLNEFIEQGFIDEDFADHAADLVLSENVKRLYKL